MHPQVNHREGHTKCKNPPPHFIRCPQIGYSRHATQVVCDIRVITHIFWRVATLLDIKCVFQYS